MVSPFTLVTEPLTVVFLRVRPLLSVESVLSPDPTVVTVEDSAVLAEDVLLLPWHPPRPSAMIMAAVISTPHNFLFFKIKTSCPHIDRIICPHIVQTAELVL